MTLSFVALADIAFDAGTQIRAAISEIVVTEYAERMTEGAEFPPIVLFHDGIRHYLADGFHRALAAKRNDFRDIAADVRPGTMTDALWFALGANRANAHRMTPADKKHAIVLALQAWPEKSMNEIAEQVGCSRKYVQDVKPQVATTSHLPDRVTGKDGKSYPAARKLPDRSPEAVKGRTEKIRTLAAEGHNLQQIAKQVGLAEETCRDVINTNSIDVPANRAIGKTRRHDSNRIVEHIVMDAENLTADVGLIEYSAIDRARLGDWIDALTVSHKSLASFIRRLTQEHKKHVERTEVA